MTDADAMAKARQVKTQYQNEWLGLKGVVGVGLGETADGRPGIIISVQENPAGIRQQIPTTLEGVPIEVRESGEFRAL